MTCRHEATFQDDVDGNAEIIGDLAEPASDIPLAAEPKLTAVDEAGDDRLGDEPSRPAVGGRHGGRLVEQRARVEDLQDAGAGRRSTASAAGESWRRACDS